MLPQSLESVVAYMPYRYCIALYGLYVLHCTYLSKLIVCFVPFVLCTICLYRTTYLICCEVYIPKAFRFTSLLVVVELCCLIAVCHLVLSCMTIYFRTFHYLIFLNVIYRIYWTAFAGNCPLKMPNPCDASRNLRAWPCRTRALLRWRAAATGQRFSQRMPGKF